MKVNDDGSVNIGQERPRLIQYIEYNSTANPKFLGLSEPNNSTVASTSQIKEIIYDSSDNPIEILFAGSTSKFIKSWSARESYNYG